MSQARRPVWLVAVLMLIATAGVTAQESMNRYYAFPLSLGVGYAPISPVLWVDRRSTVNEIVGQVRLPIPGLPALQPYVAGGMLAFDSDESDVPTIIGGSLDAGASMPDHDASDVWDHSSYFGGLGLGFSQRLSKEFELGLDATIGFGSSVFPKRFVSSNGEWYPVASVGAHVGLSGKITLNPSFNLSIDVNPALRYERSFGAMRDFDGLYFGVGFSASYRFGRDPDAPSPDIRAIRYGDLEMPPAFAAMQSVYVDKPLTTIELTNLEADTVDDIQVSFFQPGFMDSPTVSARIESIGPAETVRVPILASFNREVFYTNGITPLNGEIVVQYKYRNRPVEQRQSVTYDLHDRNALTWDDDRKVAAFMTHSDSAIRNYASFIRSAARNDGTDFFPDSLEFAMQAYHALASLGILYQPDPSSPFTQVQEDTLIVDSVNLPRETLRSITGDCDDLTVLYNSMLESVGIPTGFVTIPGHIYSAINTELKSDSYSTVHPDPGMTVEIDGTLWLLVEITLVGQSNFIDAWRTGMQQWHSYDNDQELRAFNSTFASQELFRPVGLTETDLGLQYGDPQVFLDAYRTDLERLSSGILTPLIDRAQSRNIPRSWNHLGVIAGRLGQFEVAQDAFGNASRLDPSYVNSLINMGSLHFMRGNYSEAIVAYENAEDLVLLNPEQAESSIAVSVFLNLSRALYAVNRYEEAASYVARAETIDAARVTGYENIGGEGADQEASGARAGNSASAPILFVDDEGTSQGVDE